MMIRVLIGNIFSSDAQTVVNTVNCVGVMGKGIALEFKKRFPDMFKEYEAKCKARQLKLGRPYLHRRIISPWILNFPTKDHWRSVSKLEAIVEGLQYLKENYEEWGISSLAIPPLGCGHGQLDWTIVGPLLYRHLSNFEIPVELYAPANTPVDQLDPLFLSGTDDTASLRSPDTLWIEPSWLPMIAVLQRIVEEPYHHPVGRTVFQKIAYFTTEAGVPTGLSYRRGSYGPFSSDLRQLVTRLVNNGLVTEEKLGRMFAVRPGPTFDDASRRFATKLDEWSEIVERVSDLFLRMDTKTAEAAATVHFAAHELARSASPAQKPSEQDVFDEVKHWKQRRQPPLDESELARAIRNLNAYGWIDLESSETLLLDGNVNVI